MDLWSTEDPTLTPCPLLYKPSLPLLRIPWHPRVHGRDGRGWTSLILPRSSSWLSYWKVGIEELTLNLANLWPGSEVEEGQPEVEREPDPEVGE